MGERVRNGLTDALLRVLSEHGSRLTVREITERLPVELRGSSAASRLYTLARCKRVVEYRQPGKVLEYGPAPAHVKATRALPIDPASTLCAETWLEWFCTPLNREAA